ncbi:FAD/NAD(P)-binding domain-containing protein [Exidia glandulosa HHB12029]|uniref:FAD/NAD(P)-binding domain-containing protein n=1 Tax=Exidia glandulosa HHB12029 TaxID=1314781 RepID=A0A165C7F9_EXIGL|nr:FAD/NAD(P)-binding domain-containing protein [Exidia glandulosa HHB12029]
MADTDAQTVATRWLQDLSVACAKDDASAFQALLLPDGVYRDLLCLSWDFRSLSGREAVDRFLRDDNRLARAGMHAFAIDASTGFGPPFFYPVPGAPPTVRGIQLSFTFKLQSPPAVAKGLARLMQDPQDGRYKAFTLFTSLHDLIGHEEIVGAPAIPLSSTWRQIREAKVSKIESDPTVLIVGAAQNGLLTAARLGQMGIPALVIEREAQVGDSWRQRYDSLKLHTYSRICSFLYESYPQNFPQYMPKDRLADALEAYVKSQDLVVWTSAALLPTPTYDDKTGRWTVVVMREGKEVHLRPKHIVMATGFAGEANIPSWPGKETFKGVVYHSGVHPGGHHFEGKNVVVVGAGQSAADICMDFVRCGAENITMVQRSATCVTSLSIVENNFYTHWPEARSVEDSDFAVNAFPQSLLLRLAAGGGTAMEKEADKEMHEGLRKAGFQLTWGQEYGKGEIGMFGILLQRFGGYWLDQGCAQNIASGRIALKQGQEIARYDEDGLVFADGSKLAADVVVLATGYKGIRHTASKIFGKDLIDKTTQVWGLDDEGETRGMYRPSGHPGLWYAVGGFNHARFYSRHLGLQILAKELELKA